MSLPNFVQATLDSLNNNWDTNNFSPQPTLINGDDMTLNSGGRARSIDVVNENVITVDSSPEGNDEPIGTEYDFDIQHGVNVQVEGYHADGGGQLADKSDFNDMYGEARRAILVDRTFPTSSNEMRHLILTNENDLSRDESVSDANYFRYTFDVLYYGYETLP